MLILSRKKDQDIVIGEGVVIRVVEIRGDKVRLGVVASRGVAVDRREVWEAKKAGAAVAKPEKKKGT